MFCGDDEYIGSTIRPLSERMNQHRKEFKTGRTRTTSCLIFQKHGLENVKIELIEEFSCENVEQLHKREGEIQRERKSVNKKIAGRTKAEYYKENVEEIKHRRSQYYQDHIEEIRQQHRQYNQDHAEENRERCRQYRQDHAEELREKARQYHHNHAEERREYKRQYYLRKKTIS